MNEYKPSCIQLDYPWPLLQHRPLSRFHRTLLDCEQASETLQDCSIPAMPAFAPLPPSIPHTLAPSSPLPSTFSADTHAFAARLSRTDAPRRKSGVLHHAPQGLGLPDLVCTGVDGDWEGWRPPWVDAERRERSEEGDEKLEEEQAWRELGVAGIPKDMDEWEDWERVKRDWREKRRQTAEQVNLAEHVTRRLEVVLDASTTDGRQQKSTASASTLSSTSRPSQPTLLTSHFSSSKHSVPSLTSGKKPSPPPPPAGDSSKKKRPPSSPPPLPHPPLPQSCYDRRSSSSRDREAPAPTGQSGDSGRSGKASFPSLSSINSAGRAVDVEAGPSRPLCRESGAEERTGRREVSGEDEEILFEGGCTQVSPGFGLRTSLGCLASFAKQPRVPDSRTVPGLTVSLSSDGPP